VRKPITLHRLREMHAGGEKIAIRARWRGITPRRVNPRSPAASARVKALEEHADVPLLAREARGVRLTPAGEAFLHHARGILRQTEQLRSDMHEYARGLRGHVRIHAPTPRVSPTSFRRCCRHS